MFRIRPSFSLSVALLGSVNPPVRLGNPVGRFMRDAGSSCAVRLTARLRWMLSSVPTWSRVRSCSNRESRLRWSCARSEVPCPPPDPGPDRISYRCAIWGVTESCRPVTPGAPARARVNSRTMAAEGVAIPPAEDPPVPPTWASWAAGPPAMRAASAPARTAIRAATMASA